MTHFYPWGCRARIRLKGYFQVFIQTLDNDSQNPIFEPHPSQ